MQVTTSITGTEEIVKRLRLLPERLGRNAIRRSLRKGANVIRDQARTNARQLDDNLSREAIFKNIVTQGMGRKRERQAGGVGMRVGVLGGARAGQDGSSNPGGDTFYWRFLEFGTSEIAARPFMRTAMSSSAEKAISTTIEAMKTETAKELAKMGVR
jgi:HK97 gp10 family phage protein